MIWTIPSGKYKLWNSLELSLETDFSVSTGEVHQIKGMNGSGKSSFLKQLLLPYLRTNPGGQYVMYIEQQVQSQMDAITAYSDLHRHPGQIQSTADLLKYQFFLLKESLAMQTRPCIIIADECSNMNELLEGIQQLGFDNTCLIFVAHQQIELLTKYNVFTHYVTKVNPEVAKLD